MAKLFLALVAVLGPALAGASEVHAAHAQQPEAGPARGNSLYLPVSESAKLTLARGDRAALSALQAGAGSQGQWVAAFEAWRAALVDSGTGASVPVGIQLPPGEAPPPSFTSAILERWPDRDNSFERRTESIESAVLRRLSGLDPAHRRAWTAHFNALAEEHASTLFTVRSLSLAKRAVGMAAYEREFPCTPGALRACLWLFEAALEGGSPRNASVWLQRARMQAQLLGMDTYQGALDARQTLLNGILRAPAEPADGWAGASEFRPLAGHPLTLPLRTKPRSMARIEGQPGLAFMKGGAVLVQTTGTCWLIGGEEEDRIFEPWRLGLELTQPIPRSVNRTGRDWPFYPLAEDGAAQPGSRYQDIYIVSGRADGETSNLLQRIRPPFETHLPTTIWSLGGGGLYSRAPGLGSKPAAPSPAVGATPADAPVEVKHHAPIEDVLEAGMWEFQPGPILIEGTLFVQARRWVTTLNGGVLRANAPGEAQTWILALDAATGWPRWKRMLCRGTDITSSASVRLTGASLIRTPAQPLRATERMLFVGTNLGAAFLLDLADGRLITSLANDRREASSAGWQSALQPSAWEGPRSAGGAGKNAEPILLWAPADGLELYGLRAGLDFAPRGSLQPDPLLSTPPLARGESLCLLGGTADEVLVLGKAGARRTVSSHNLHTGARLDSIYLVREEEPIPGALLQGGRLLFATDRGLYRLDRDRELYLENFQPLRMASDFAPGGLFARGSELYLLAAGALFHFRSK